MTELETLQRAKMYLDKLANGIDPLTGREVPQEDLINNIRISRCFFYVSDVLRQVIEKGGINGKPEKIKKVPFSLTLEQRNQCYFSQEPVTVSMIVRRINALIDERTMTPLKTTSVTDWMMDEGFLEQLTTADNHHIKRASPEGEKLGIHNEDRQGQYGAYTAVIYDLNAQHFILDNLDSILSFAAQKLRNEGNAWTGEENRQLRALFQQGMDPKDIAIRLARKPASVKQQLKKIGPDTI